MSAKKKATGEYRFRWDDVVYQPGELKVVTYKNGKPWARDIMRTAGEPAKLELTADRQFIAGDGKDICFITVRVTDNKGITIPEAASLIKFEISGPAEIVATDNGDAADLLSFSSNERAAFSGMALAIVCAKKGAKGTIRVKASSSGLTTAQVAITAR